MKPWRQGRGALGSGLGSLFHLGVRQTWVRILTCRFYVVTLAGSGPQLLLCGTVGRESLSQACVALGGDGGGEPQGTC